MFSLSLPSKFASCPNQKLYDIISSSVLSLNISNILYAIIGLYVSSYITDKVLLGISECKTFYRVTDKEKEVNEFITTNKKKKNLQL